MAIIYGDRVSRRLFPSSIEDYVGENDPVRAYDAIIDALDPNKVGLDVNENKVGAPPYDPVAMLKLLVYGYSYGIRSSRKLERACHHNVSFVWLLGGLKPDFKTIANFRRDHRQSLEDVLFQCSQLCLSLGLIDGNVLFVDSSKFRANANMNQGWDEKRCRRVLKSLKRRIDDLLSSCDRIDAQEDTSSIGSYVEMKEELKKELKDKGKLKKKVEGILKEFEEGKSGEGVEKFNSTDRDSVKVHGRQGTHAGYTAQVVTDEKSGLIVHKEVLSKSNDHNEFSGQVKQAEKVLGKEAETACGDGGYFQVDDLKTLHDRGTQVVVPSRKHSSHKGLGAFDKENFSYDEKNDEYICPVGHRLRFNRIVKKDNAREYVIRCKGNCIKCDHFGKCTTSKLGRRLQRKLNEKVKEALEKIYESEAGRKIYNLRKERAELPFGHMKRNLGAGYFLLRGLEGVNAEMSILSTCFNISRMVTLLGGIEELRRKIMAHKRQVIDRQMADRRNIERQ
jgi:transposase